MDEGNFSGERVQAGKDDEAAIRHFQLYACS